MIESVMISLLLAHFLYEVVRLDAIDTEMLMSNKPRDTAYLYGEIFVTLFIMFIYASLHNLLIVNFG